MYKFYNKDCVAGAKKHIKDNTVDLIITDPPYGIDGDKLDKHYNRDEKFVLDGYVEIPQKDYPDFSLQWIKQAERVLKPGGAIYIVSGYSNLIHILNALRQTKLKELNHIIWKYNFGVYTQTKYVSSHYHILYYVKPDKKHVFNTYARFADHQKTEKGGSANYKDREDVWVINRDYKPGQVKNKNELPTELLTKMMQYSSNEDDLICDFFLGSFSTAKVAKGLNRNAIGFEVSEAAFKHQMLEVEKLQRGFLIPSLTPPDDNQLFNRGKKLSTEEKEQIIEQFQVALKKGLNKKQAIEEISQKFGRGYWSILRILDATTIKTEAEKEQNQYEIDPQW